MQQDDQHKLSRGLDELRRLKLTGSRTKSIGSIVSLQAVDAFDEIYGPVCDSCGHEVDLTMEHAESEDGACLCKNCLLRTYPQ